MVGFASAEAVPGKLEPDGWAAQLYEAAARVHPAAMPDG